MNKFNVNMYILKINFLFFENVEKNVFQHF